MRHLKVAAICGLAMLMLPIVSQAQSDGKKLIGKWEAKIEVDEEKMKELLASNGAPPELLDTVMEQAKAQISNAKLGLEFKADNKMVFSSKGLPQAEGDKPGTWEIVKEEKNKIVLKSKGDDAEEVEEMTLTFDGDDKFTMTSEKLKEAPLKPPVFTRVKADKDADKAKDDDKAKDADKDKDGGK